MSLCQDIFIDIRLTAQMFWLVGGCALAGVRARACELRILEGCRRVAWASRGNKKRKVLALRLSFACLQFKLGLLCLWGLFCFWRLFECNACRGHFDRLAVKQLLNSQNLNLGVILVPTGRMVKAG